MNCADVQSMLWSGTKSEQMTAHLSSCLLCQQEADMIQLVVGKLGSLSIPAPSRSLIPDSSVIRQAIRRNKGNTWRRTTSLVAGVVLVLSAGSTIGAEWLHHNQSSVRGQKVPPGNTNLSEDSNLPGNSAVDNSSGNSNVNSLVDIDAQATNPDICAALQAYLMKILSNRSDVKHIQIRDFVIDPGSTTQKTTGTLLMNVDLQPGTVHPVPGQPLPPTSFVQGKQVRYVLLDKPDGAWAVDGIATTPAEFANGSTTADDLAKTTQELQGTLIDFNFRPFDDGTGINRMLDFMTLKVEQNLTTTGGTLKPGDVVRIEVNKIVPTQGQGHFELANGERLIVIVQQADPRYNLGETVWYCQDLNHFAYEVAGKYYNWLGYAVEPQNPLQPLQPIQMIH